MNVTKKVEWIKKIWLFLQSKSKQSQMAVNTHRNRFGFPFHETEKEVISNHHHQLREDEAQVLWFGSVSVTSILIKQPTVIVSLQFK